MSSTVKTHAQPDVDSFFAGVDEVRTYLDRQRQDPRQRRARLSRIAAELLKPRSARALSEWLVNELSAALGASAAALLTPGPEHGWQTRCALGEPPLDAWLARATALAGEPILPAGELWIKLEGVDGLVGILAFTVQELDDSAMTLVLAIADTASVVLERAFLGEATG